MAEHPLSEFWHSLRKMAHSAETRSIRSLFDKNHNRASDFSLEALGIRFDYSKTNLDEEARTALMRLASAADVETRREAMFNGAPINETEHRAVLHTALRANDKAEVQAAGEPVIPSIVQTRERMEAFSEAVREVRFAGQSGKITDIINIGIGGSDLGPAMATAALSPYHDGPRCHFVSNVDGAHIHDVIAKCDARSTLVIVASKTFTTIETMTNARTAWNWMKESVPEPSAQFVALSSAPERIAEWGIPEDRVFSFGDYVGGRYSVWGPIGLSLMIAIGPERFREFLAGAREMDQHFRDAPFAANMPVLHALIGIWHAQIMGYPTRAVLPYDQRLAMFPAYLQQLEMESNGKSVQLDGMSLSDVPSGPVVWGAAGTNGQHAFYQLLHQGTAIIPCEFMIAAKAHEDTLDHHHRLLIANCLAQSEALMCGRSLEEVREKLSGKGFAHEELERQAAHRVFSGNRPSITFAYEKLTPYRLGSLIALYEHRVFVEGVILGINSFDQWGVELGKKLATELGPAVNGAPLTAEKDASTKELLAFLLSERR